MSVSELTADDFDELVKTYGKFDDSLKESQKQVLLTARNGKDARRISVNGEASELAKQISSAETEKKKALKEF